MAERRLEIELRAKTEQWERDLQRASQRVEELANRAAAAGLTMDQRFEKEIEEADAALVKLIQDARNLRLDIPPEAARNIIGMRLRLQEAGETFQQVSQLATREGGKLAQALMRNQAVFGQLSFAIQDFVAVLSQPGMGLNAALRASANNFAMLAMTLGGPLTGAISAVAITMVPMLVSALQKLKGETESVEQMWKRLGKTIKEETRKAVEELRQAEELEALHTEPERVESIRRSIRERLRAIEAERAVLERELRAKLEEFGLPATAEEREARIEELERRREVLRRTLRLAPEAGPGVARELGRVEDELRRLREGTEHTRQLEDRLRQLRAEEEQLIERGLEAERIANQARIRKLAEETRRWQEERKRQEQERQQKEREQRLQQEVNRWAAYYARALRKGGQALEEAEHVIRAQLTKSGVDADEAMRRLRDSAEKLAEVQEAQARLQQVLRDEAAAARPVAPAGRGRPPAVPPGVGRPAAPPAAAEQPAGLAGAGLTFQQLVRRRAARLRRLGGLSPREALARAREELGIELENRMLQARGQAEEALIREIVEFGRERGIELDPLRLRELVQTGRIDPAQLAGLTLEERRAIFRRVSAFRQRMRGLRADVLQGRMPVGAGVDAMAQVPQAAQRAADAAQQLEQQQRQTNRTLLAHLERQARTLTNLSQLAFDLARRIGSLALPEIPAPRRGRMR